MASAFALAILLAGLLLHLLAPDLHYVLVQEDAIIEWISFWAFLSAALICARQLFKPSESNKRYQWSFAGISVAAAFIAFEEISWGQRVFGYALPDFLVSVNDQQEANLHNIVSKQSRNIIVALGLIGYGVILPIASRNPNWRQRMDSIGLLVPGPGVIAGFVAVIVAYAARGWTWSQEWAELALGIMLVLMTLSFRRRLNTRKASALPVAFLWAMALSILGTLTMVVIDGLRSPTSSDVRLAILETQTLADELEWAGELTHCNQSIRVLEITRSLPDGSEFGQRFLALPGNETHANRRSTFSDPWNTPYYVRHWCTADGKPVVFVYS